jgi:phosphonate transport system substrate-binding protein
MRRRSQPSALAPVLIAAVLAAACGGHEEAGTSEAAPPVFRFTAIPDQNTTELIEKFAPLASHLSQELGVTVEYAPARDYQATVEMFKNGDAHLAWFGGLTGVQARSAVEGARAIAQGEADPRYYSYFVAHRDTGLERADELPADLSSYKFTFGSESSTSGRLMPEYFIRQATGKAPAELFASPVGFSGSHDKTVELVESGQYEVGAVNYKVYDKRVAAGKTDPEVCRVIWQTPLYADYNWTVRPDVDAIYGEGFTDRLQAALVAIDDPQLLAALPRNRLIPATNDEFEGIRAVAEELGMLR